MDVMHLFESYSEFADHARDIKGYGDWSYKSKKALHDLNEWFAVYNEGVVTREGMKLLEDRYRELHQEELEKEGRLINEKRQRLFKTTYRR